MSPWKTAQAIPNSQIRKRKI